jgi:chromosomal replication initiation ATPase DnaA
MHSAIHDPRAVSTPSQRLAAAAQNMRRAKIAAVAGALQARRVLTFVVKRDPPPVYWMWFEDLVREHEAIVRAVRLVTVQDIQQVCAFHYGVSRADILSPGRMADLVRPRQVAMYLTRKHTDKSWHDMGRRFGGRDHTTGIHAVRKIAALIEKDAVLAAEIARIEMSLAARIA